MPTADEIMSVAASQVGYQGGDNKRNKYTEAYGTYCDWCVIFLWWVFREAKASGLFGNKCALCSKLYYQHTNQAVIFDQLKRGDVVFFDWSGNGTAFNHVGIVESRNGNTISTIEGNTSNAVRRRTRNRKYVSHAYRPAYSVSEPVKEQEREEAQISLEVLRNGSKGFQVRTLQRLLKSYGYSLNPYGIDGEFGALTEKRLQEYQRKQGLSADGVCNRQTWEKLLKG